MIVFALAGVLFLIGGWGAYAGRNRRWLSRPGIYAGYLGPGLVLIGAGLVLMGLTEPISLALAPHGPTTASGTAWALGFFGGLALTVTGHFVGTSGMPARFRPGWVREVEGLAPRHGDPAPSPRSLAPAWASVSAESPAAVGKPLVPPLDALPQRSMLALERAAWGGARSAQKDPGELKRLQDLGLLREDLTPTPQGSLLVGRLYRDDARTAVVHLQRPGARSVVITVVDEELAVLEYRQDWGSRRRDRDTGRGSYDVIAFTTDDDLSDRLGPWVTGEV